MADSGTGEFRAEDKSPQRAPFSKIMNWAGALMSLALIGGLGAWAYQLAVRDVSGVPVVLALEGPMRVLPDDPGGLLATNQGLAVNRVQAVGEAAPTADRLVLAPVPVGLIAADQPGWSPRPRLAPRSVPMALENQDVAGTTEVVPGPETLVGAGIVARVLAVSASVPEIVEIATAGPLDASELAVQLAIGAAREGILKPEKAAHDDDITSAIDATDVIAAPVLTGIATDIPGVSRSPRPALRPANLQVVRAEVVQAEVALLREEGSSDGVVDVDVASLPLGTNLVQLGAYDSPDVARAEWAILSQRLGDYLDDKQRVVQMAKSGGKTFYRLRALGFKDINDARRFCSALMAENAACIPVVLR